MPEPESNHDSITRLCVTVQNIDEKTDRLLNSFEEFCKKTSEQIQQNSKDIARIDERTKFLAILSNAIAVIAIAIAAWMGLT